MHHHLDLAAQPPVAEGTPYPLGVTWIEEEQAYNFALYSRHAERVTLLLYGEHDFVTPLHRIELDYRRHKSGRVWHCRLAKTVVADAQYYAYQVAGPPAASALDWHRFDPDKILLDPYATSVFFPATFDRAAAAVAGSNAGKAPLGFLCACESAFDWTGDRRPRHTFDSVIYELHVRQFTANPNSGVREAHRGTYLGVAEMIPYLQDLGITVVELMPILQNDPQEGSHWGYMPLNFFAPDQRYAASGPLCGQHDEFRQMVRAFHAAGIEVITDVVYNHTAEGDASGPVYSFKGIDNSTYYLMSRAQRGHYENFSGTGNTLHCANRAVRRMILDSLRHWARDMGIDGFRFDLASVFTRAIDGTVDLTDPLLVADVTADTDLAGLRLIAEPWDAAGVYQLGRSFPGVTWLQWNGRFRDDVRRFVRGDAGLVPSVMYRLYGSDDLFPDDREHAYRPAQSVNYVTSHDGFTLYDLVAYNERRNWPNGHQNTDGASDNFSWNCGWEGDERVPDEVVRLRKRQAKNFCALLFLSNGTPMLRAGDEFLQTQHGNSNPYNQDNDSTWLDWSRLREHADVHRFFKLAIAFRKAHPTLGRSRFWREDVHWHGVGAEPDLSHESHSLAFHLRGAAEDDQDLYVMINAYWQSLAFTIQAGPAARWARVIDTSLDPPDDFHEPGHEAPISSLQYVLGPRSVVVLLRRE
ncbi:MAG: isoamylase [Vicinamibacterales bacterium]